MAAKKGLGKGLDSLIADKVSTKPAAKVEEKKKTTSEHAADAIMMDIAKVEPNREQPRKKFDEDALLELAESIKQFGVILAQSPIQNDHTSSPVVYPAWSFWQISATRTNVGMGAVLNIQFT